jgi:drug/metabolite transporter (DMT)-like permease
MTDNLRGILAVLVGSTAFVGHDAAIKLVSAELPSSEIIVVRGLISTVMFLPVVWVAGAMRPLSILFTPLMLVRVLATAAATVFIVLSLRYLSLATVTTVLHAAPLLVTAGAAIFYRDVVGWRRWAAILTGFLGVILIVRPGDGEFGVGAWLILVGLLCTTTRDLATRGLPKDIPALFIAAAGAVMAGVAGFAIVPLDGVWIPPTAWAWAVLTASSAFLLVATTAMVTGLRSGEIAVVAPFRYALVPFAVLLGWWLWGDMPNAGAFVGIALVLGAGLYTLHRERATLRRPVEPAPAEPKAAT